MAALKGQLRVNIGDASEYEAVKDAREALQADTPHVMTRGGMFSPSSSDGGGPARYPCSKLKLDQLFLQWLSLPESNTLVLALLEDAKAGKPLQPPTPSAQSPLSPSTQNALFTPPLSPQKARDSTPHSPHKHHSRGSGSFSKSSSAAEIPRFYFPDGMEISEESIAASHSIINAAFDKADPSGITADGLVEVVREVCELPSYVAHAMHNRMGEGREYLPKDIFLKWLNSNNILRQEPIVRLFHALRSEENNHIVQENFKHLLLTVLMRHPGLEFLQETPEFQERYAETVIYRIFYGVNRSGSGRITLRELKKSDLLQALNMLDDEEDINKILKYFSYEHFYVIYCKFWELDTDHDFMIDREDLLRYGNHALTYRIVDRIFEQVPRRFVCQVEGKMGYEDFCWFILSEEDKTSDLSLEYWFECVDLDCDGAIRPNEMLYFYEEQLHRMECLSQEPVLFEDVLCQMTDMMAPEKEGVFTMRDLKKQQKLAGTLFNILFNLNKFIAFETRDPFLVRQEREDPLLTEWDRFARAEYVRLAMEEEGDEAAASGMWEDSLNEASL